MFTKCLVHNSLMKMFSVMQYVFKTRTRIDLTFYQNVMTTTEFNPFAIKLYFNIAMQKCSFTERPYRSPGPYVKQK